jgi:hypothetical protein
MTGSEYVRLQDSKNIDLFVFLYTLTFRIELDIQNADRVKETSFLVFEVYEVFLFVSSKENDEEDDEDEENTKHFQNECTIGRNFLKISDQLFVCTFDMNRCIFHILINSTQDHFKVNTIQRKTNQNFKKNYLMNESSFHF